MWVLWLRAVHGDTICYSWKLLAGRKVGPTKHAAQRAFRHGTEMEPCSSSLGAIYNCSTGKNENIIEGSLEIKLPTIWTDEKQSRAEAESRKIRREKSRRERVRRTKMQMPEKVGKSWFTVFLQWFVAQEGRKVGLLKRRVRSQLTRWEIKKRTPL